MHCDQPDCYDGASVHCDQPDCYWCTYLEGMFPLVVPAWLDLAPREEQLEGGHVPPTMTLVALQEVVAYDTVELGPESEPLSLVQVTTDKTLTELEGGGVWVVWRGVCRHWNSSLFWALKYGV